MSHAVQMSRDTTSAFAGIMLHDGTNDTHLDVFGGANWDNTVWVMTTPPRQRPLATNGEVIVNVRKFVHRFAPHGEAAGGDLAQPWLKPHVEAPGLNPGQVPLFSGAARSRAHGHHRDDVAAMIFAIADGDKIEKSAVLVVAAHHGEAERHFLLVSAPEAARDADAPGGVAALAHDAEAGNVEGVLALLGDEVGAVKEVTLDGAPVPVETRHVEGVGIAASFSAPMAGLQAISELTVVHDAGSWTSALVPAAEAMPVNAAQAAPAPKCRPASAKATKWGAWSQSPEAGETAAFTAARAAAGRACHKVGDGGCGANQNCTYTETSAELLESEERQNNSQTEYRSKVKSEGRCECQ